HIPVRLARGHLGLPVAVRENRKVWGTMNAAIPKHGLVGALVMLAAHVLAWMGSYWSMLTIPPRYEKLFSDHGIRLPATTEVVFTLAHRVTSHSDLLWAPLLFLLGLDAAALVVLRWSGERGWSWAWFLVVLVLLLLLMTLMGAGIHLAEWKLREAKSRLF